MAPNTRMTQTVTQARKIGPFALAECLGEGAGTRLYRAIRPHGARPPYEVCLRVAINPLDSAVSRSIRTEYETLRAMDNPRIPRAYGHYPDESAIAMSYYAGASLSDVIQAQSDGLIQLNISSAIDFAIEVAHGLRHAHSMNGPDGQKIVHGHLGPQRIRITPHGEVVIVGFGCLPRGRHPAYTPPEIAEGGPATPRSDQWILGSIMVEMIVGERLYSGAANVDDAVREGDVTYWVQRVVERHPELAEPLTTMLAPAPEHRFAQNHQLLKSLLAAGRKIGGTVNRRSLAASVMAQGHHLTKVRPERDAILLDPPTPRSPSAPEAPPFFDDVVSAPSVNVSPAPSFGPNHTGTPVDPSMPPSPPAPPPAVRYLPSEIAGTLLGGLMFALGAMYVMMVV